MSAIVHTKAANFKCACKSWLLQKCTQIFQLARKFRAKFSIHKFSIAIAHTNIGNKNNEQAGAEIGQTQPHRGWGWQ